MKLAYDFSYLGVNEEEKKPPPSTLLMEKRKREDNPIERSVLYYT